MMNLISFRLMFQHIQQHHYNSITTLLQQNYNSLNNIINKHH